MGRGEGLKIEEMEGMADGLTESPIPLLPRLVRCVRFAEDHRVPVPLPLPQWPAGGKVQCVSSPVQRLSLTSCTDGLTDRLSPSFTPYSPTPGARGSEGDRSFEDLMSFTTARASDYRKEKEGKVAAPAGAAAAAAV